MTDYKQHAIKQLRTYICRLRWLVYVSNHINDREKINPNYLSALIGLYDSDYYDGDTSDASKAKILSSLVNIHMAKLDSRFNYEIDATSYTDSYIQAVFPERFLFRFVNSISWLWSIIFEYFGINKVDGFLGLEKYITLLASWLFILLVTGIPSIWWTALTSFLDLGVVFPLVLSLAPITLGISGNRTGIKPYNKPLCKWIIHRSPKCTKGYFLRYMYEHQIEPDFSNDNILTVIDHSMFSKTSKWSVKIVINHVLKPLILTRWHLIMNSIHKTLQHIPYLHSKQF